MSSRRAIGSSISITLSIDRDASGHARLDASAGLARAWMVAAMLAVAAQASAPLSAAQPAAAQRAAAQPAAADRQPRLSVSYGKLPLSFEANQGQSEKRVKFLARGPGYSLFLTPTEAVLSLRARAPHKSSAAEHAATGQRAEPEEPSRPAAVVRMRLAGANTHPKLTGLDPLPGTSNYFIGNDPERWRRDVPTYARVKYASVYPGVDLIYYGNQRQLEYDIVVAPGADATRIALAFEGVQALWLDPDGDLVLQTSQGAIAQHKPVIYQNVGGKRQMVDGRYVLRAKHRVGFHVARYDTTQPLVIDPVLSYSTYLGGNSNDIGYAIAVDSAGSAYVTGVTTSTNFPTAGPFQATWAGSNDLFVTKLNAAGNALVYSSYLGGSNGEIGYAIAVDSTGNAYVTGETDSGTQTPTSVPFPTTVGAFQTSYKGGGDAFITKINAAGDALVYSTYLGGSGNERGYGIAVDGSFNVYVAGHTSSSQAVVPSPNDFPTAFPFQAQNASVGSFDAFVTKINAAGSALVYSTFLGGNGSEYSIDGGAIAVDSDGNAYVVGTTRSTNFPGASTSTIQPIFGGVVTGRSDGFVVKFNIAGSALLYSTYLGGTTDDSVNGIALDSARNAYVVGSTDSPNDFPTASPLQAFKGGPGFDAFVSKINAAGSALVYSTYLGGSAGENAYAVAVDSGGNAYVSGFTTSSNFPTVAPFQAANAGSGDAFISELNPAGSALVFSTYLGGSTGSEFGYGIALDSRSNAYITGQTNSTNFPTVGPFQATLRGSTDAFVAKVNWPPGAPTGLTGSTVGSTLSLSWTAPATGDLPTAYIIEAGSAPGLSNFGTHNTGNTLTSFSASGLGTGEYYLRVRSTNAVGTSAPSNEVRLVVGNVTPGAPSGLTGGAAGSTLNLSWTAPATGGAPTAYVIEAGSATGLADLANFSTGNTSTSFSAPGVPYGRYYLRVRAANLAGTSGPSNETVVVVGPPAPGAPSGLTWRSAGSTISLSWTAPLAPSPLAASLAGGPPTAYIIEAGSTAGSSNLANFSTGSTSTFYAASGIGNGTYFIRVKATNTGGMSGPSNEVQLVVGCTAAPGAATSLHTNSNSGGTVQFGWTAPNFAGSSNGPTTYVLEAGSTPGSSNLATVDLGGPATTATFSGIGPGTYYVRVKAKNLCGTSAASNEFSLIVP